MAATNAPPTRGKHHASCRQGLSSFFLEHLPDRFGRDALDVAKLDQLLAQQPERPVVMAVRGRGAGYGDQMRGLVGREGTRTTGLRPIFEHRIESTRDEAATHP